MGHEAWHKDSHPDGGTHQEWTLAGYSDLKLIYSKTLCKNFLTLSLYRFLLKLLPCKIKHNHLYYKCPQSAHIAKVTLRLEHFTFLRHVVYIQTLTWILLCNHGALVYSASEASLPGCRQYQVQPQMARRQIA